MAEQGFTPDPSAAAALRNTQTRVEAGTTGMPTTPQPQPQAPAGGFTPQAPQAPRTLEGQVAAQRAAGTPTPSAPVSPQRAQVMQETNEAIGSAAEMVAGVGMGLGAGAASTAVRMVPYLNKLPMAVVRVVLGALGEETVNDVFGGTPGEGLKRGALGGGIAEGAAGSLGAARSLASAGARRLPVVGGMLKERAAGKAAAGAARLAEAESAVKTAESAATSAAGKAAGARQAAGEAGQEAAGAQASAGATGVAAAGARARADQMAASLETQAGQVAPPLGAMSQGAASAAKGLDRVGTFYRDARTSVGEYQASKLAEAEGMLPAGTTLRIPALAHLNEERAAAEKAMGIVGTNPLPPHIDALLTQQYGPRVIDRFSLTQVAEEMKQIGVRGYAGLTQPGSVATIKGKSLRDTYNRVMNEVEGELTGINPAAWDAFREGRHAFSVGNALIDVMKKEGVFLRQGADVALDPRGLQVIARKHAQVLKDRMSDGEWDAFKRVVFEGSEVGARDTKRLGAVMREHEAAGTRAATAARKAAGAQAEAAGAERTAAGLQETAAQARQRLGAMQAPPSRPWGQQQIGRVFLDAAVTRALGGGAFLPGE